MKLLRGLLALLLLPSIVFGAAEPQRLSKIDGRVVRFVYHPDQIYPLTLYVGYVTQIVVSQKERIIVPDFGTKKMLSFSTESGNNHLAIKPVMPMGNTNVILTTELEGKRRTYIFDIDVKECVGICSDKEQTEMMWRVTFDYSKADREERKQTPRTLATGKPGRTALAESLGVKPGPSSLPEASPSKDRVAAAQPLPPRPTVITSCDPAPGINRAYYASGESRLRPLKTCDNGTFMRLEFSKDNNQKWPAPYAVDLTTRKEQLLNYRKEGSALIIEGTYDMLVLRFGEAFLCIFNGARINATNAIEINPAPKVNPPGQPGTPKASTEVRRSE